jgi:antitoxin component YwqK of YwqJK toxin-antitoxin module
VVEYKDDKRFLEYGYKNGIQEGLEIGWHTKTGTKQHVSHWILGEKQGLYIAYWPNGKKRSSVNYTNDVKEGLKTVWHKNGQTDYQQNYSGGTRLGSQFTPTSSKPTNTLLSSSKPSIKTDSNQFKDTKFKKLSISKDDMLKEWEGKYIVTPSRSYSIHKGGCFYVSNRILSIKHDGNIQCNKYAKDVWIEDNGKLCIEYNYRDDCRKIRKLKSDVYKFGSQKMKVLDNL